MKHCPECNRDTEVTPLVNKITTQKKVTDQKRKDFLKSDYEIVETPIFNLFCNYCGHVGTDFTEVTENVTLLENEPIPDTSREDYLKWLKWLKNIQEQVKGKTDEKKVPDEGTSS